MKLMFMALAEDVLIDSRTNRMSVINLIEELPSPQFPALFPNPSIILVFEKDDGDPDHTSCSVVFSMDGHEIARSELGINFSDPIRVRSLIDLNALIAPRPGKLVLRIEKDEHIYGVWEVLVREVNDMRIENTQVGTIVPRRESAPKSRKRATSKTKEDGAEAP